MLFFSTVLDQKPRIFKKKNNSNTKNKLILEFDVKNPTEFKMILSSYSKLLDFFYQNVLQHDITYKPFIRNVEENIRRRIPTKGENWAVIRVQTRPIEEMRNLFENFNLIYPKLFVHAYFEELYDGYLGFFNQEFDMAAIFGDPTNTFAGFEWFNKHGFQLPEDYKKRRINFIFSLLTKKTPAQ